jgi:hypothetical protein
MVRLGFLLFAAALVAAMPLTAQAQTSPGTTTPPPATSTQPPATSTQPPATAAPATPPEQAKPTPKSAVLAMPEGPPPELKKLAQLVGNWNSTVHVYESPMGPESETSGKSTYGWAFGGMHIEGKHQMKMMGKPFDGRSTWGYDTQKKQYQMVWTDTMMPSAFMYYGTFPTDNTVSLFTTYMIGDKPVTERVNVTFPDANSYVLSIENDMSGSMQKVMEEKGVRAAANASAKGKSTAKKTTTTKSSTKSTTKKTG